MVIFPGGTNYVLFQLLLFRKPQSQQTTVKANKFSGEIIRTRRFASAHFKSTELSDFQVLRNNTLLAVM